MIQNIFFKVVDIIIIQILCKTILVIQNLHTQNHGNAYPRQRRQFRTIRQWAVP